MNTRMNAMSYINDIIDLLTGWEKEIGKAGGLHLFDRHKHSEDFCKRFFNLLYKYNLKNVNLSEENFPAIDLGDDLLRKCLQITSDPSSTKIKKTIRLFIKHKLYEQYDNLTIFIIGKKGQYKKVTFDTQGKFAFNKEADIIDIQHVIKEITAYDDIDDIKKIRDFLKKELGVEEDKTNATEVETIMDLITYLSESKSDGEETVTGDPDPEKKIMQRFSGHASYLIDQMQEYIPIYQNARMESENKLGIDRVRITLIRGYLMDTSISFLNKNNNDPQKALDELVSFFVTELGKNGKKYDYGAIKFYLLQEIINCNVFPNPVN